MILLSLQVYNKKCADLIFSVVSASVLLCYWGVECVGRGIFITPWLFNGWINHYPLDSSAGFH